MPVYYQFSRYAAFALLIWKFTEWMHDTPELYNLREDPQELHNLVTEPSSHTQVQWLKQRLHAWYPPFTASTGDVSLRGATSLMLGRQQDSSIGTSGTRR